MAAMPKMRQLQTQAELNEALENLKAVKSQFD
jgi:hypothetical protein